MKIAVLGGTFNPVHIGHLTLAQEVVLSLGYERVIFVPALISPFKQQNYDASAQQRCDMVRLSLKSDAHFDIDLCEIERGGVSYTCDTLQYLSEKYSKELAEEENEQYRKPGLIIGSDLIDGFSRWKNTDQILEKAVIILAERGGDSVFEYPHIKLHNALLPVSSTEIRQKIQNRKSWQYLVTPSVYSYIVKEKLYG